MVEARQEKARRKTIRRRKLSREPGASKFDRPGPKAGPSKPSALSRLKSDDQLRAIVDNLPCFIFRRVLTTAGIVSYPYISPRMGEQYSFSLAAKPPAEMPLHEYIHPDDRAAFLHAMAVSAAELTPFEMEFRLDMVQGPVKWMRTASYPHKLASGDIQWDGIALDVTKSKARETHLAHHDLLTGLPNRILFVEWLGHVLARAKSVQTTAFVIAMDLVSLADIRENSGFDAGDASIRETAKRLQRAARGGDTIAYAGGGVFLIALLGIEKEADFTSPLRAIMRQFDARLELEGQDYPLDISMGISIAPDDGDDAETLIRNATTALNKATYEDAWPYQFYNAQMTERAVLRLSIESELRRAIEKQELVLFYQPIYRTHTLDIVGAEALIRWRHPERGLVPPGQFIPVAEETGLIGPLGEFALRQACTQAREWQRRGVADIPISVNLSGWQLIRKSLGDTILGILSETGLAPARLKLEITESTIVRDVEAVTRTMTQLADAGVRFSVDDFGIEHSALSYLSRLPIETLKIDYSFISQMTHDRVHAALVQAIILMTHAMAMTVVAEGVETQEQLTYLQAYQCDALQGFLFSEPVPAEEFEALLTRRSPKRDKARASADRKSRGKPSPVPAGAS